MIHMDHLGAVSAHEKRRLLNNIMSKIDDQIRSVHRAVEEIMF